MAAGYPMGGDRGAMSGYMDPWLYQSMAEPVDKMKAKVSLYSIFSTLLLLI